MEINLEAWVQILDVFAFVLITPELMSDATRTRLDETFRGWRIYAKIVQFPRFSVFLWILIILFIFFGGGRLWLPLVLPPPLISVFWVCSIGVIALLLLPELLLAVTRVSARRFLFFLGAFFF